MDYEVYTKDVADHKEKSGKLFNKGQEEGVIVHITDTKGKVLKKVLTQDLQGKIVYNHFEGNQGELTDPFSPQQRTK